MQATQQNNAVSRNDYLDRCHGVRLTLIFEHSRLGGYSTKMSFTPGSLICAASDNFKQIISVLKSVTLSKQISTTNMKPTLKGTKLR